MKVYFVIICLAAVVLLASPAYGPAYATPLDWQVRQAQRVAERSWPTVRAFCPEGVTIEFTKLRKGLIGLQPDDAECVVLLDRFLRNPGMGQWEWLCATMVHEYGHLADPGNNAFAKENPKDPAHSPHKKSIMYYRIHFLKRCGNYGRKFLAPLRQIR